MGQRRVSLSQDCVPIFEYENTTFTLKHNQKQPMMSPVPQNNFRRTNSLSSPTSPHWSPQSPQAVSPLPITNQTGLGKRTFDRCEIQKNIEQDYQMTEVMIKSET